MKFVLVGLRVGLIICAIIVVVSCGAESDQQADLAEVEDFDAAPAGPEAGVEVEPNNAGPGTAGSSDRSVADAEGTGSGCPFDTVPVADRDDSLSQNRMIDGAVPIGGEEGNEPTSLLSLGDGRLAVGYRNGYVRIWEIESSSTGGPVELFREEPCIYASSEAKTYTQNHARTVFALAELPDGRLATGWQDGTIRVWDPTSPDTDPMILDVDGSAIVGLYQLPDGALVASAADGTVRSWAVDTFVPTLVRSADGAVPAEFEEPDRSLVHLGGSRFATINQGGFVATLDLDRPDEATLHPTIDWSSPENFLEGIRPQTWVETHNWLRGALVDDRTLLVVTGRELEAVDLADPLALPVKVGSDGVATVQDVFVLNSGRVAVIAAGEVQLLETDQLSGLRLDGAEMVLVGSGLRARRGIPATGGNVVLLSRDNWARLVDQAELEAVLSSGASGEAIDRSLSRQDAMSLVVPGDACERVGGAPLQLDNGTASADGFSAWIDEQVPDHVLVVDLNRDGSDDVAAVVNCLAGGNAVFQSVLIWTAGDRPRDIWPVLSDRAADLYGDGYLALVEGLEWDGSELTIRWLASVDGDPRCCPSFSGTTWFTVATTGGVALRGQEGSRG